MKRWNVLRIRRNGYGDPLIRRFLKEETGFQVFEWSLLMVVLMLVILILLPDFINIGRYALYGSNAASYAIARVAEQGKMDQAIANDVIEELNNRGIVDCYDATNKDIVCFELYGTSEQKGYNSPDSKVETRINIKYRPRILAVLPNIRLGNAISVEDGIITMGFHKVDMATPYIRE